MKGGQVQAREAGMKGGQVQAREAGMKGGQVQAREAGMLVQQCRLAVSCCRQGTVRGCAQAP